MDAPTRHVLLMDWIGRVAFEVVGPNGEIGCGALMLQVWRGLSNSGVICENKILVRQTCKKMLNKKE